MGRYQRFIESGYASLYLSIIGSFFASLSVVSFSFRKIHEVFDDIAGLFFIVTPAPFVISFSICLAVLFDPPIFKRSKVVLIRIAMTAMICVATITSLILFILFH